MVVFNWNMVKLYEIIILPVLLSIQDVTKHWLFPFVSEVRRSFFYLIFYCNVFFHLQLLFKNFKIIKNFAFFVYNMQFLGLLKKIKFIHIYKTNLLTH